jgi:hypothetical protein
VAERVWDYRISANDIAFKDNLTILDSRSRFSGFPTFQVTPEHLPNQQLSALGRKELFFNAQLS